MTRSRTTVRLPLALAALVLALLWHGTRDRGDLPPAVSFQWMGTTNHPTKGSGVLLRCLNAAGRPVCLLVNALETRASGSWTEHALVDRTGTGTLTTNAFRWLVRFDHFPGRLDPGESATFFVPQPGLDGAWRVRFEYREQTWLDRLRRLTIGGVELPARAVVMGGEYFTGQGSEIIGPEIPKVHPTSEPTNSTLCELP